MRLLEDVFIIENLQVINEGKNGSGPMKIQGCFQRADEANNNKRIYRKPLLEREITKLADAMNERRLMGELDHPQHDSVKLSNVSHLITGLNMKGNEVIGEAEILDTPSGKVAKALIDGGVKIGISSRGMGTVTEELDGKRYVNEDFKLITWDIVADPSTRGAYPGLTESTEIQEIIDRVLPEAQKVKNFTTLLKEELISEVTNEAGGRKPSVEAQRERLGRVATRSSKVTSTTYSAASNQPAAMEAHRTPAERRTDAAEKKKAIAAAAAARQQNSSTQFVNFMRDKLMEAPVDARLARRAALDHNEWYKGKKRAKLSPASRAELDRRIAARKKAAEQEYNTPQQHSSTQFVNFMRDKLMEAAPKKHDDTTASFVEVGGKKMTWDQYEKHLEWMRSGNTARQQAAVTAPTTIVTGVRSSKKYTPKNDSTQFVNFMRDKLNEKTRWQKKAEERAKPSGDGGKIATFQTMSGSRRGSMRGMIPDLRSATIRSYKAASTSGGLGRKAAAAADAGSQSSDARAIRSLRAARARLRRGKDSREARPIAHKGGENRNPGARGMPVLKRMEDKLKSGNYHG